MKRITEIIQLILVLILVSCHSEEPNVMEDVSFDEDKYFDTIWFTRHYPDKEIVSLNSGVIYKDWYLYTGDTKDPFTVLAYNKSNGLKDWEFVNEGVIVDEIDVSKVFDDVYIGVTSKGIVAVDLNLRETLWEINLQAIGFNRGTQLTRRGNDIYHSIGKSGGVERIIKFDLYSGIYDTVYELDGSISPAAFWEDPLSDQTLMIFNHYPNLGAQAGERTQNIVAVDLLTRTEVWRVDNFTQNYASNVGQYLVIHEDDVITGGDWSMYSFDVRTGDFNWRTEVPNYTKFSIWNNTNHLLHNDRLYVNPLGPELMCLNPSTGDVIWQNLDDAPNCTDNMVYYKDMIVFTSWGNGSVQMIDAFTGEMLHREHRFDDSSYNNDVVYDPETDMFFTSTFKHAIGFKVNKPD